MRHCRGAVLAVSLFLLAAAARADTGAASLEGGWLQQRASVVCTETPLSKVLTTLGKMADVTFEVPPEIDHKVTFEMIGMSARDILDVIAISQSLAYTQEGDTIRVEKTTRRHER